MNTISSHKKKLSPLFALGFISAIISTTGYSGDAEPLLSNGNRLVKTMGPIMLYEEEKGRGVTAMQFQLSGLITSARVVDDVMILVFSGDIEITGNGRGPFSPIRDLRTDKWDVEDLPVQVHPWSLESSPWANRILNFDETVKKAERYAKDKRKCRVALRDLSVTFTETGSVLYLKATEALIMD